MHHLPVYKLSFRLSIRLFITGTQVNLDRLARRTLDLSGSLLGLIVCLPIFCILAICIKLTDGGPVLYFQTRIGDRGKPFPFPKFRSMSVNADQLVDHLQKRVIGKTDSLSKCAKILGLPG